MCRMLIYHLNFQRRQEREKLPLMDWWLIIFKYWFVLRKILRNCEIYDEENVHDLRIAWHYLKTIEVDHSESMISIIVLVLMKNCSNYTYNCGNCSKSQCAIMITQFKAIWNGIWNYTSFSTKRSVVGNALKICEFEWGNKYVKVWEKLFGCKKYLKYQGHFHKILKLI